MTEGLLRPTPAQARTVLARAFVDDPLMAWFFPDADVRPHACAALFGRFAEHYLRSGRVDALGAAVPVAVAMWRWPVEDDEPDDVLPTVPGLMTALMGTERVARIGSAMSGIPDRRPPEPHAYLHVLGVDPAARGRGLGGQVLEQGLAAAREAGLVACLETVNPANVPFYLRHGLEVRAEVALAHGGPTVWMMATTRA
jgi:ribosomal protein S18 acetylase RimI-like enzyme